MWRRDAELSVVLQGVCSWNENPEREKRSFVVDGNSASEDSERAASLQGMAESAKSAHAVGLPYRANAVMHH